MSTPEDEIRFAEAFNELGEAAEVMVEPPAVADIRGRVRRRRTTRVVLAAVAALALVAPASWMLQQDATAEEQEQPVIADDGTAETADSESGKPQEPTPSAEHTLEADSEATEPPPLLSFDDLLGATFDLPSFMPDEPMVDSACVTGGAVLQDGTEPNAGDETGRINLLEVVHAPLTEGGHDQTIAFLGCRFAEASAFQAVVIEPDGDDWVANTQLIVSKSNADSPYDIAAADGYGVLVGVAEHFACCDMIPDELEYWIEKVTLDDAGEPVSEHLGEGALPDLSVQVFATEDTAVEGRWTVSVLIVNEGDAPSGTYFLLACGDPVEVQGDFAHPDCLEEGSARIETIAPLGVGEEVSFSWEVTVVPPAERVDNSYLQFSVEPDTVGASGIARDGRFEDNWTFYAFE